MKYKYLKISILAIVLIGLSVFSFHQNQSRDVLDITLLHKLPKGEIKLAIGDVFAQPSIYYQKLQNRNLIKTNNEQTISLTLNLNL